MSMDVPKVYDVELVREVMLPFNQRNYLPAIKWLNANAPDREELIFKLQCQHIIWLLENSMLSILFLLKMNKIY